MAITLVHKKRFLRLARNEWVSGSGFISAAEFATWIEAVYSDHSARHENGGADEIILTGLEGDYIRLTPKASCAGPEGSIYYDSDDNHIYVGTE